MRHSRLITLCLCFWFGSSLIENLLAADWQSLSPYQRQLVGFVLPASSAEVWQQNETQEFLEKHGTRSSTYHAIGMLLRNQGADRKNAQLVIRNILKLQLDKPGDKLHGVWRTGPTKDKQDENWREFIGVGLIIVREYFADVIDPDLMRDIDQSLMLAAEGTIKRDVSPQYTNIALLSAVLIDYAGHIDSNEPYKLLARSKIKDIFDLTLSQKSVTEFNSPTYYGVDVMALAMCRRFGHSREFQLYAKSIEEKMWMEIAETYHPDLKNMCGPYTRSYGMDMKQYIALLGLSIAMGLDDPQLAPLPQSKERSFEWAYAPLFALLEVQPPEYLLPRFRAFRQSRQLKRLVPFEGNSFEAQSLLQKDWMMGAATGMRRRWDQHYPATVHWSTGKQSPVGWLLVSGTNAAEAKIEDRQLQVFLHSPEEEHPLRVLVQAPEMQVEQIDQHQWSLTGMTFDVKAVYSRPKVEIKQDKHLGKVIEIAFPISKPIYIDEPVLVLTPRKQP